MLLNNNYNLIHPQKHEVVTFKSKLLSKEAVDAIKDFKLGRVYEINEKLRGLKPESLTLAEQEIISQLSLLPQKILSKDTYVYRGVCRKYNFNPFDTLKVGTIFLEKGFTSLAPLKRVAKLFRHGDGILEKILLPKGTKVLDIDSLLKRNASQLPDDIARIVKRQAKHEWVLMPNSNYKVIDFVKKATYRHWTDLEGKKYQIFDGGKGTCELHYIG